MKLFSWLQYLFDQLLVFFRSKRTILKTEEKFLEELILSLQEIWEAAVATVLVAAFGYVSTLYVIFYPCYMTGETIMEIWDPNYYDSKPSQIFKLKQAPQNSPLPKRRSEAKVLTLENWH